MIVVSERTSCSSLLVDRCTPSALPLVVVISVAFGCLFVVLTKDRAFKLLSLGIFDSDANMFSCLSMKVKKKIEKIKIKKKNS